MLHAIVFNLLVTLLYFAQVISGGGMILLKRWSIHAALAAIAAHHAFDLYCILSVTHQISAGTLRIPPQIHLWPDHLRIAIHIALFTGIYVLLKQTKKAEHPAGP
jgi:hypothetical protein